MFIILNIANSSEKSVNGIDWFSTGSEKTKSNRENKGWSLLSSQSVCQAGIRSRQLPARFYRSVEEFYFFFTLTGAVIYLIRYSKTGILSYLDCRVFHCPSVNLDDSKYKKKNIVTKL